MKKYLLVLAAICLICPSISQGSILFKPKPVDLGFPNVRQEARNWCWAAVVQQILIWRGGNPPSQCQLVNEANRDRGETRFNCCENQDRLPRACDRPGNQLEVMSLINRYGGRVDGVQMPDTPRQVHEYLAAGKALVVGVKLNRDNGHAFVIKGISWENDVAMLLVNDPVNTGSTKVPFEASRPDWVMTQTITR